MPKDFKISVPILRQFLSSSMFADERFHFFSLLPLIVTYAALLTPSSNATR